jgi:S-adenosylmethionine:tRNA ribosyltransferase-isomerase
VKFHRHASVAAQAPAGEQARSAGGSVPSIALLTDEVSRHAVRLVAIDREADEISIKPFRKLPELLRAGDLVVVNDAATLPASLPARSERGDLFEVRLSSPVEANRLYGVVLGAGDHRTRTEHRAAPPKLATGDRIWLGTVAATVAGIAGRRIELVTREAGDALWQALYASGKPVQYAHRGELLPLYAVQTAYAARPWAAEMPSAGRPLTWDVLLALRRNGVAIATLTHAAGLSSTGDEALDRALPWPERYEIPRRTIEAIAKARDAKGRVIAIGTTVVRALEAAASQGELEAGSGVATLRLDGAYKLRIVDGLVSGLHAPGESHFDLLSAFAPAERLTRAIELAASHGLSSHELGDACLLL